MRIEEVSSATAAASANQVASGKNAQESQKAAVVYTNQGKSTYPTSGIGRTYETIKYDKVDDALLNKINMYNQYAEVRNLSKEQSSVTKKAPSIQTSSGLGKNTMMNNESMVYFDRLSSTKTGNGNSIINVIKLGDSGTDVYEVQQKLQALGMLQGGYAKGQFDESTLNALNTFKNEYGSSSGQNKKEGVLNQNTKTQIDQKLKEQALKANALVEGQQKQRSVEFYEKNEKVHTKEELEKIKIDIARMDTMKEIARVAGPGRAAQIESNSRFADETLKAMPEMLRASPYIGAGISATELIKDKNIFTNEKLTEEERFGAKAGLVLSAIGAGALSKPAKPVLSSAKGMVGNLTSKIDDVIKAVQKVDDVKINTVNSIPNGTVKPEAVKDVVKAVEGGIKTSTKTNISSEMQQKILEGQRKLPTKNEIIGGHSSTINNENTNFAVEVLSENLDGTKNIQFVKDLLDGGISKLKKSTIFPDSWSESKIIDSIKQVGDSSAISVRSRDGATWHRQIIDGVEIDVIKIGDDVISGYPTGKINAPKPSGF